MLIAEQKIYRIQLNVNFYCLRPFHTTSGSSNSEIPFYVLEKGRNKVFLAIKAAYLLHMHSVQTALGSTKG